MQLYVNPSRNIQTPQAAPDPLDGVFNPSAEALLAAGWLKADLAPAGVIRTYSDNGTDTAAYSDTPDTAAEQLLALRAAYKQADAAMQQVLGIAPAEGQAVLSMAQIDAAKAALTDPSIGFEALAVGAAMLDAKAKLMVVDGVDALDRIT